jgi:hypothetical protein
MANIVLHSRDLKGSRLQCLLLTNKSKQRLAAMLTGLVSPLAVTNVCGKSMPRGFLKSEEARLGATPSFLNPQRRQALINWWPAVPQYTNTPNWDLAASCKIDGKNGLILVDAMACNSELCRLASLGVPVVLMYLGFLNSDEAPRPIATNHQWKYAMHIYADPVVPSDAWDSQMIVNGTPFHPMIRSLDLQRV